MKAINIQETDDKYLVYNNGSYISQIYCELKIIYLIDQRMIGKYLEIIEERGNIQGKTLMPSIKF